MPVLDNLSLTGAACGNGWAFFLRDKAKKLIPIYPTIDGDMSFDTSRDVRRSISGQVLLPTEFAKLETSSREMFAFLILDGETYPMGVFLASEISRQPDVILDPDEPSVTADLVHISWADRMIRLRANDGSSQLLYSGADPSYEMGELLAEAGLEHSLAGTVSRTDGDISWDGSTTLYDKISTLAELAGHRPPWPDNNGTIRSVTSALDPREIIPLQDLLPVAGSLTVSDNYLSAPNRVIVTDNSGTAEFPIVGVWNAPASAPHSESNRGWVQTEVVSQQGISTSDHALLIANTLGESYTGRTLNCSLALPTDRLDGPVFLSYDRANWLVTGWSISLGPNETMSLQASEFFGAAASTEIGRQLAG